ncbi:hypothetical protein [Tenacibaculum phage Larrie]|nr:hypothetical protein [Tenacibaculum phage Larrie]
MKNEEREARTLLERRSLLIKSAIDKNFLTYREISKVTGLKLTEIKDTLGKNKELNAEYRVCKRMVSEIASDNIFDAVMDKTHPKNYEASKLIITKFKSEFDEHLESADSSEIEIGGVGSGEVKPITIKFGKK